MDRGVVAELVVHELRELPRRLQVVADLGDNQVRDLDVRRLRVPDPLEGVEDRVRVRDPDVPLHELRLPGALEVHGDAVEELRHLGDGLRGVVPVRHEDVHQPRLASRHPDVPRELHEDRGLVVRVREALAALFEGHLHDVLGLDLDPFHLPSLADVEILAVRDRHEVRRVAVVLLDLNVVHGADVLAFCDTPDGK